MDPCDAAPFAHFGNMYASDLVDVADIAADPSVLDAGWWAVVATFEGQVTGYRFATVRRSSLPAPRASWPGITGPWRTSLQRDEYLRGVQEIRRRIAVGDVYQVNLCRLLTVDFDECDGACGGGAGTARDPLALAHLLAAGNPAQYQGVLRTDAEWVVTASPELFLRRRGREVTSAPIKGTAPPGAPFAAKDIPENVMICDLVRNDLGRVAETGSVRVESLLAREELPGLAHLVSTVRATIRPEASWGELLAATLPPGSVSGAPKHTALQIISELEAVARGPYCGAVGYIDGNTQTAELAVGIRTFFTSDGMRRLNFGTGAGITYLSDPADEWAETELKAERLITLASAPGVANDMTAGAATGKDVGVGPTVWA